jgi:hypothetical protein
VNRSAAAAAALAALTAAPGAALAQQLPPLNPGDRLGEAVAFGDFNGDGRTDVAVGATGARVSSMVLIRVPPAPAAEMSVKAGKVLVFMARANGEFFPPVTLQQGMLATNETGDEFGSALSSADFDGDGRDDLAVGAPGEPVEGNADAGAVFLYQGSEVGLLPLRVLAQTTGGLDGAAAGARYGSTLASGDFTGDGRADLVVGAPGRAAQGAGAAYVYMGREQNFDPQWALVAPMQRIDQELGELEVGEAGDGFGSALAAVDFDGDKRVDLAVGAPGEGLGREPRGSGAVFFFRSAAGRLVPDSTLDQETQPVRGVVLLNQAGDAFGSAVASADFNGDGMPDLAVGAPGKGADVGAVFVYMAIPRFGLQLERGVNGMGINAARYGQSLSAGDYNGDRRDDLSVGAPGRGGGVGAVGTVYTLVSQGALLLQPRAFVTDSRDTTRGELGSAITSGDLNGDGRTDLAIGVPGANFGGTNAGRLLLLSGAATGLGQARDLVTFNAGTPAQN